MDVREIFEQFCKEVFPSETIEIQLEQNVTEFEAFYSEIVKVIQKDDSFFGTERIAFGRNLSDLPVDAREVLWKNLVPCMLGSFFHGDIRTKVGKLSGIIKNIWNSSGQENDAITGILNDEKSEGRFQEILDFVLNSRLAKIFTNLLESFDFSDLDFKIDNPADIIEMMKNPENPVIQKITGKIHKLIEEKIRHGEFTQQTIVSEIEAIKAKLMGLFGNIFNDALGGRKADVPSAVMTGNSPEARRQRMLARMQRKLHEKNSQ